MCHYLLRLGVDSDEVDPKAAAKHLAGDGGVQVLAKVRAQLAAISEGTAPAIHTRAQRSGRRACRVAPVVHRVVLPGLTIPRWVRSFPRLRVGP